MRMFTPDHRPHDKLSFDYAFARSGFRSRFCRFIIRALFLNIGAEMLILGLRARC